MVFKVILPIISAPRKTIADHRLACFKTERVSTAEAPTRQGKEGAGLRHQLPVPSPSHPPHSLENAAHTGGMDQ